MGLSFLICSVVGLADPARNWRRIQKELRNFQLGAELLPRAFIFFLVQYQTRGTTLVLRHGN